MSPKRWVCRASARIDGSTGSTKPAMTASRTAHHVRITARTRPLPTEKTTCSQPGVSTDADRTGLPMRLMFRRARSPEFCAVTVGPVA